MAKLLLCPHDGGTCHHACASIEVCFRERAGLSLTTPWFGYPLPGHGPSAAPVKKVPLDYARHLVDMTLAPGGSADSNLQHVLHAFEGYRAYRREGAGAACPYSEGSARAVSWREGFGLAAQDKP